LSVMSGSRQGGLWSTRVIRVSEGSGLCVS
jgi:hypothetical protein